MAKSGALDGYRKSIISVIVKQVMAALIAKLPFLAWGPFAYVAGVILEKIFSYALKNTILGINIAIVDWKINDDVKDIKKYLDDINKLPVEDKDARDKIEQKLIESAKSLITLYNKPKL